MQRILAAFLLVGVLVVWHLTTTVSSFLNDPLGVTTRTTIQAHTALEMTRLETDAAVEIANVQANALIEATKVKAQEERRSHQAWADAVPEMLLIMAAGGALWLVIIYRGRARLLLLQKGIEWSAPQQATSTSATNGENSEPQVIAPEAALKQYAAQHNQTVFKEHGYYLLVDNQTHQVVKQLARKA